MNGTQKESHLIILSLWIRRDLDNVLILVCGVFFKGVWALKQSEELPYHNMLCITFVGETRFLLMSGEDLEMVEVNWQTFDLICSLF